MANDINLEALEINRINNARQLKEYRNAAEAEGLSDSLTRLPRVSDGEVIVRRGRKRHVRAYMTQMLNYILDDMQECPCVYLLFDEDGCLLRMKASEETGRWLSEKGIVVGSLWKLEQMGPNAVTMGLADLHSHASVGEENYQKQFRDMAMYYAPLLVSERGEMSQLGGIAVMVPLRYQNASYQMAALVMCHSIVMRISMAWNTSYAYEADSKGMVLMDVNIKTGAAYITHHNNNFFDTLGLPRVSMRESYFTPADDYIDPLPANREFWEIIKEVRYVEDLDITLSVHGKPVECILTTAQCGHVEIKSKGVLVYITTRSRIARQAAEKTGNNAILSFDNIIGNSLIMKSKIKRGKLLARTDSNIMLLGESGVGKDVFAQAIHNQSGRWKGPFVAVNCGALPRDLIASELFGYDGGAFTGAKKQGNIGKFELANGGTLFLDEIGEMPLDLQATLLRAVEQKQFMRLGSNRVIRADVRIISATNVDITHMIEEKKFRSDLYYRLCTMSIFLPPLRERGDDVILLAEHFIREISSKIGRKDSMVLTEEAKNFLRCSDWRGNVRELQNLIDCLVQLYPESEITLEMIRENVDPSYFEEPEPVLPQFNQSYPYRPQFSPAQPDQALLHRPQFAPAQPSQPQSNRPQPSQPPVSASPMPLEPQSGSVEIPRSRPRLHLTEEEIREALERCGGNRSKAAERLGVGRRTLYRYIDQFGIGNK